MSDEPRHKESEIVEFVRSIDVRAPQELHERVEAMVAERAPATAVRRTRRLRVGLLVGAPAVAAAAIAVLVVSLTGNGSSPLTVDEAVALTLRPPTMAAPVENPRDGAQLTVAVDGIPFPYWEDRFGWRATGERMDRVGGRDVTTVYYTSGRDRWLGYAIVGGTPAPAVANGRVIARAGTHYRLWSSHGASVVTWLRSGRLCVIAGHGVSDQTLLALAGWHAMGAKLTS